MSTTAPTITPDATVAPSVTPETTPAPATTIPTSAPATVSTSTNSQPAPQASSTAGTGTPAAPTTATASPAPSSPAPAATATPAPASGSITLQALASLVTQQLIAAGAVQHPQPQPAAAAPAKPVARANLFAKGQLVVHRWFDDYTGRAVARWGIVVGTLPDHGGDDVGARSIVAWLEGPSGPIGDEQLEAG